MRVSQYFLTTLKEAPAEAELASHRLMLRSGMIKRLAAGIYTWLPLGLRVLRKVEAVVREEMNAAGAIELLMPVVQPAELWQESGRWDKYGPELLRLKDRHQRDFIVQPTSEEVITDLARKEIKSYKQLPLNLYHIQVKFRDEVRPRFGVRCSPSPARTPSRGVRRLTTRQTSSWPRRSRRTPIAPHRPSSCKKLTHPASRPVKRSRTCCI